MLNAAARSHHEAAPHARPRGPGTISSAQPADPAAPSPLADVAASPNAFAPSPELKPLVEHRPARQRGAPLYFQVYTVIRQWITSGKCAPGESLPGEQELAQSFGVARVTVRTAMANLQREGLVEKRRGLGTFVAQTHSARSTVRASMADVLRHIREIGRGTTVQLLSVEEVGVPPGLREVFGGESSLQRIVRVRSVGGEPLLHVVTYLPRAVADRLDASALRSRALLDLFEQAGIELCSGRQTVGASVADTAVARALHLEVGEPLLLIRRVHCDADLRPVEYLEVLAPARRFELHMELDSDHLGSIDPHRSA